MFSKKKLEKQLKESQSCNRKTQRELERDRAQIARNEAQLKAEIRKNAAQGNMEACAILAKQLVKCRQQVVRTYEMSAKLNGITNQQTLVASNMKVANVAKIGAEMMSTMNKQIDKANPIEAVKNFSMANMKISMTEEAMNDALDNIFGDTADEEDAVVNQVLDELGIETSSKLVRAPTPSSSLVDRNTSVRDTVDIEAQLERLRGL